MADLTNDFGDDDDFLFDSPVKDTEQSPPKQQPVESRFSSEEAREAALKQELENVRKINQVIEGVVESLEKAKSNMETVSRTVNSASTLLHSWTRILSQAEHNQRLILNPQWQGAMHDLSQLENDAIRKQQEIQRKQLEEQQRREAAARKAEEDECKRAASTSTRGTRGLRAGSRGARGAAASSGSSTTSAPGYTRIGGYGGRGTGRTGSSTGRAGSSVGRARARGRGVG